MIVAMLNKQTYQCCPKLKIISSFLSISSKIPHIMHYEGKPVHHVFQFGTTDLQENDAEAGGVKRARTVESTKKQQQGNVQEKSNKGQHSCKTGHLSKLKLLKTVSSS